MRLKFLLPLLLALATGALAVALWRFAPQEAAKVTQSAPAPVEAATDSAIAPAVVEANAADDEPTKEDCVAAVDKARALANPLPADHPSRYIAERHLHQSMAEAGNGEFDDCLYWAERAADEVREQRHAVSDKINVLQSDQLPAKQPERPKAAESKHAPEKSRH